MEMAAPAYTTRQVDNCAFAAWYPQLKKVCVKGVVVPLPSAFVSVLLADGVKLPPAIATQDDVRNASDDESEDEDDAAAALTDEQQAAVHTVRAQVEQVLADFGGRLFPKTNWSCPRDAAWMLGTMKCTSFEDLFLLLQASDFVVHDLTQPYIGCSDVENVEEPAAPKESYLVLKKWCNLFDSMLFRCFVVGQRLVGVSQRNCGEFYEFLPDQQDQLCDLLYAFYTQHFRSSDKDKAPVFPDDDFSFDVYVDKQQRVFLLDINVFGDVTDTLLFSWAELLALRTSGEQDESVDFRVVESKQGIRANPLSGYRAPTDLVDHLAGGAGFDAFMEQVKRDNAQVSDSDSDSDE